MKIDEAIKFAWAYLILHGRETSGVWSFYGSGWEHKDNRYPSWDEMQTRKAEIQERVLEVGIDFDKSGVPEVTDEHGFLDTFASTCSKHTATLGKLVLKNGETFLLGSDDDDAAALARTAKEMIKTGTSEVSKLAEKL